MLLMIGDETKKVKGAHNSSKKNREKGETKHTKEEKCSPINFDNLAIKKS